MRAYGKTDVGRVRESNQDAFICGRLSDDALFVVVCDGMGGANGGNVASALAVKVISDRIMDVYREGLASASVRNLLESAIAAANVEIFDTAMADVELRGMGTTVVAAILNGRTLFLAHVGDSRAYLAGPEGLEQLTRDHSIVQAMVEKGQLTQDEAKNHPRKHFITRALGVEETVECDYMEFTVPEQSRLLICTDGLTNMVESEDIFALVQSGEASEAPERLIHAANMAGGSDNITAVVIA
ncbi:MAG TPA: Stp1/IreP family PP2C-type Ser/Thr phosphatase [Firmicutes bacterium]|nr:Stp1/IreP family PP2C-type Ser/Thr phosphatase [Bacillota bacterium]